MKIIDAHMHYFNIEGFKTVAANAGYENTAACWQQICEENNIVFSVAMGNTEDVPNRYGGISPRLIDLNAPFDDVKYNQPDNIGYCLGVKSEQITLENAGKTALEFEYYAQKPQCVGIKIYPGYRPVYVYDKRHWPLFELARAYNLPVAVIPAILPPVMRALNMRIRLPLMKQLPIFRMLNLLSAIAATRGLQMPPK